MSWADQARKAIAVVHASLPADATIEQRKKALFDAYPFGERQFHPYKMWLREQRLYLERIAKPPKSPTSIDWSKIPSPLDLEKARAQS